MHLNSIARLLILASTTLLFAGCATQPKQDYAAYKQSRPKSILVLPPVNNSPDVNATFSMYAQVTQPLAESGYYVLPVSLVSETFKQNGLSNPPEMHAVAPAKLAEIFGADAGLYITINNYGATYTIVNSQVVVSADAKLMDLKTGTLLWSGSATASNNEGNNNGGGGLAGMLIAAVVKQVLNNVVDASHPVAGIASQRLLAAGHVNGLLYGPRSANYGKD
jgi:hypothetical protein